MTADERLMVSSQERWPEKRDREAITPELALVDPVLAASARQHLPDVGDSLIRSLHVKAPDEALAALASAALETEDGSVWPSGGRRSRSWGAAAGVAAVTVVVLLLLDVRVQVGRTPASAETAAIDEPQAGQESAQRTELAETVEEPSSTGGPRGDRETAQPRRFAWAPTAGASGYHVELFRGSAMVFSKDTSSPQMTVPARWTHRGKPRSLSPGEYRWYVWPVAAGRRAAQAIVQAKLVVPSS